MTKEIERAGLNKVTHTVRAAQAVMQYGAGAMVDFPDQTLVTTSPELWRDHTRIYDDRFASILKVDHFGLPSKISYNRFPEWYFCPKCRSFKRISEWAEEYKKSTTIRNKQSDPHMIRNVRCVKCNQDLVVSRIVTVCEKGHLNDFPWVQWLHARNGSSGCKSTKLLFKTGAGSSEGLDGLIVSCQACNASLNLSGIFNRDFFILLGNQYDQYDFHCEGFHPHKYKKEECSLYPRTVQRGSSSVYFPLIRTSLVIPPFSGKLNADIVKNPKYKEFEGNVNYIRKYDAQPFEKIKSHIREWAEDIASNLGAHASDVEIILENKWLRELKLEAESMEKDYLFEEYEALSGIIKGTQSTRDDFIRSELPVDKYDIPRIKSVSLIEKVRVISAHIGFSRLQPAMSRKDSNLVSTRSEDGRWYPAYEARGEGIFIEIDDGAINKWISHHPPLIERVDRINKNYSTSFFGENNERYISAKFMMLHTLSHLLITQLSFECGYNVASLAERIYCSDDDDTMNMSGIFIYTASGDSEGTLGGLVRQGMPDTLPGIFRKAIESARTCSNDPVCILSQGQGRDALNLGACYACALLPETCCTERNGFLDRGMIIGTYKDRDIGFFSSYST